jgi:hypothetical protein
MPLYWTIDSRERLMTAVADGGVAKDDALAYLDAMMGARAGAYRRLFDGTHGEPLMNAEEIMELAVEVRRVQALVVPGPLAVVMPRERFEQFARLLGVLAVPRRPLQFFADPQAGRAWLDQPDVRNWSAGSIR